jgi:hypothetical protein
MNVTLVGCVRDIRKNELATHSPTKCTILFPDILCYNITWNTPTCCDTLWANHQGMTLK